MTIWVIMMAIMKTTLIIATGCAVLWAAPQAVSAPSDARPKKRTVWVDAPTGSLLGRGVVDAGETDKGVGDASARLGGEDPKLRTAILKLDQQAGVVVEGWTLIANAVAWQTKVPVKTLKQQQESTGLTYGELLVANSLASGSNNSFESVMAMKQKTRRWSDLARQLKINPDSLVARADAAKQSLVLAQARRHERRDQNLRDSGFERSGANAEAAFGNKGG